MENLQLFKSKESPTTVREHIVSEIGKFDEKQLYEIEEYVVFLKFRSRFMSPSFNKEHISQLYGEFAEEDSNLAEEGIADYTNSLTGEDEQ